MEKWIESLYSDGSKYFVSNPLPKIGEKIKIYIRVIESAPIKSIYLNARINGDERLIKMNKSKNVNGLSYYVADVIVNEDIFEYQFYILADNKIYYYTQLNVTDYVPDDTYNFKILANYAQPKWVRESVFYQIFPERFCNGDKNNDVRDNEYYFDGYPTKQIKDWNETPKEYDEAHCLDFYGGDLQGVKQKIPYLKELGVNAIYINPIFYAATVHKYDCIDYFTVDPHFGGDKALAELMKELHKNDMKLIIDMSINHTGTANKWFNKEGVFYDKSVGAYNNKNAIERKYYFFNDEDNSYKAWLNVETLPTLNYTSEELRKKIYKDKDSLVKKWLKPPYNIDGWRFDVANTMARNNEIQLHHEIWPEIRKSIKEENNEAYILAEHWGDTEEFLKGNEWDSAMNYFGFARPVREFVEHVDLMNARNPELAQVEIKLTAKNLANRIKEHLCKLPFVIQENQFNLFDSHDVPRLHNNKKVRYDEYRGAVIMLFTMIGTPNVYYGDEADIDGKINSMEGCRYPMPWSKDIKGTNNYKLYSSLAQIKLNEEALKYGGFKIIHDEYYVFSYARFTDNQLIITICSTDDKDRKITINTKNFGIEPKIVEEDMLGTKIDSSIEDKEKIIVNVRAHQSYLIKLGI